MIVLIVIGAIVVVLGIVIIWLATAKSQTKLDAHQTEKMLNQPLVELGNKNDAAAQLAKQYEDKNVVPVLVNIVLKSFEMSRTNDVVKEVQEVIGLGLNEAKSLVYGCPKTLIKNVTREEGIKIKDRLTAAGAVVEIQ